MEFRPVLFRSHQPSGRFQGQASDIEIHAREILSLRKRLNEIYCRHTGQDIQAIETALDRDKFMSPEESKEFGLIDEVVASRPAVLETSSGDDERKRPEPKD